MAEGEVIRGADASKIKAAAERELAEAQATTGKAHGDRDRELRRERDSVREEAKLAREEAAAARKRATAAEGRVKAARTRARNLRDTIKITDQSERARKVTLADAAVERASDAARIAQAEATAARDRAQSLTDRDRAITRERSAIREQQAAVRASEEAAQAEEKTAKTERQQAQARKRAAAKPRPKRAAPKARAATSTNLTQAYIDAQQRAEAITYARREPQGYDDPRVVRAQRERLIAEYNITEKELTAKGQAAANDAARRARELARQAEGIQGGLPGIGGAGQIPRATKPQVGSQAFRNALEKLKKIPTAQVEILDSFERAMDSGARGVRQVEAEIENARALAAAEERVARTKATRAAAKAKPKPKPAPPAPKPAPAPPAPRPARAQAPEGGRLRGDQEGYERIIRANAELLSRHLAPEQEARFAQAIAPTPPARQDQASRQLQSAVERQTAASDELRRVGEAQRVAQTEAIAEQRRGNELVRRGPTGVVPHPELYGQRQAGPFGQRFRSRVVADVGLPGGGARSELGRIEERLQAAFAAQSESARQLRRATGGQADKYSATERVDLERKHRANLGVTEELRRHRNALQTEIDSTIATTRARAAEREAMLADARARGRQPIPDSRALVPYQGPGALVRTGVSRDHPFSQLSPAELAMLNPTPTLAQALAAQRAGGGGGGIPPSGGARGTGGPFDPNEPDPELARRAAVAQAELNTEYRASEEAMRRWSAQLGIADQSMRRHGTFTTEFIEAARKGDVAYREWGWQIGAAAAKFGAWTAAGAGIYAALGAVQKVGQGAVDAASGIPSVQRTIPNLDTGDAQRQFRQLSAEFAVPIDQSSDAMMRMGAVYRDQSQAFVAARVALSAFRTGEVDTATATQQLTAIATGMGASADDLVDIFDRLNYVQNNYGVRIPDLLTGVSRLSAAWRQAGGDADHLVAYITALNRTAGVSGAQAATILSRSIGNVNRPEYKGVLEGFGIEVDPGNVQRTIDQAIRRAQQPGTTPEQIQQIARALAGGSYYQRQFVALLQDPKIADKLLGEEKAGKYKSATENELSKVMETWQMRLAEIGAQLGNLGSNLAQSGFLAAIGAGVAALTLMLRVTNNLLEIFNLLPAPLKTGIASMLTLVALLRVARRLGIGGAFEGRLGGAGDRVAPFLRESAGRTARRNISSGLSNAVKQYQDDFERTTRQARAANLTRQDAVTRSRAEVARVQTDMRRPVADPRYLTADEGNQRIIDSRNRAQRAIDRHTDAEIEQENATRRLTAARRELADFERDQASGPRRERDRRALEFGRERGLYGPASLPRDLPAPEQVRRYGGMSRAGLPTFAYPASGARSYSTTTVQADQVVRQAATAAAQAAAQTSATSFRMSAGTQALLAQRRVQEVGGDRARRLPVTDALRRVEAGARQFFGGTRAAGGDVRVGRTTVPTGAVNELRRAQRMQAMLASAQIGFQAGMQRSAQAISAGAMATRAKIGAAGTAMRGLAAQAGALLDPAALLLTAILSLPAIFIGLKGAIDAYNKEADDALKDPKTPEEGKALDSLLARRSTQGPSWKERWFSSIEQNNPLNAIGDVLGLRDDANKYANERQRAAKALADARKKLAEAQKRARAEGKDVPELTAEEIDHDLDIEVNRYQAGRATIDQAIAAVQKALREVEKTSKLTEEEKADKREGLLNQLAQLNKKKQDDIQAEIDAQNAALEALVQSGGATAGQLQGFIAKQVGLINQFRGDTTAEGMKKYADARSQLLDTLKNVGQSELDAAITNAKGDPEKIAQAYRDYEKQFRSAYGTAKGASQRQDNGSGLGGLISPGGLMHGGGALSSQQRVGESTDPALKAQLQAIRAQREQAVFEARRALAEAQTAVTAGNAGAGMPRLRVQLDAISRLVRGAIRAYGRNSKEALDLIAQQQQAESAIVQEQAGLITARSDYAAAGIADPTAQADQNIAGLEELLKFQKAHPKEYGEADLLNTMTQIRSARQALADQVRQQAEDLLNARYELLESQTDDPVARAKLEAERTAAIVKRGGFTNAADKMRAQAAANNAKREAQNAAVQAQVDDIDFDVEIGKMTREEQIKAYERLLRTAKMSQSMKKDLQRQIARLKHDAENTDESSFELGLDKIRVPTMYEVARLVKGGPGSVTAPVTNANQVNVYVNGQHDYEQLGRVLEKHITGAGKATARAAQMR